MNNKIYNRIMLVQNDHNIKFKDIKTLLEQLGFECRIKGDHHIYFKRDIDEIINIQPIKNMAKSYQIKQIRNIIIKYNLGGIKDV